MLKLLLFLILQMQKQKNPKNIKFSKKKNSLANINFLLKKKKKKENNQKDDFQRETYFLI